ncbi:DUF4352 domain-containing protein [Alteromonas lipotrueae]|uniref:DUF4352 domain-containing protein n=1 Tax=Alteromonas lipotrueae TaxID=2803814 RepID=UPI001C46F8A4|nr:DUF4352 domain-containing protein [Alteromonas lipotrueae]
MDLTNKIGIAAFATSLGSLIIAFFGYCLSKKALQLSEKDYLEKSLGIKSYLIDCYSFETNGKQYCEFAISITNLSSSAKSFSNIELRTGYSFENDECGSAISQPVANILPPNVDADYKKVKIPTNIPPKESVSGWITFIRPKNENITFHINEYEIIGISNDGPVSIATAHLLRFMDNEKN